MRPVEETACTTGPVTTTPVESTAVSPFGYASTMLTMSRAPGFFFATRFASTRAARLASSSLFGRTDTTISMPVGRDQVTMSPFRPNAVSATSRSGASRGSVSSANLLIAKPFGNVLEAVRLPSKPKPEMFSMLMSFRWLLYRRGDSQRESIESPRAELDHDVLAVNEADLIIFAVDQG